MSTGFNKVTWEWLKRFWPQGGTFNLHIDGHLSAYDYYDGENIVAKIKIKPKTKL